LFRIRNKCGPVHKSSLPTDEIKPQSMSFADEYVRLGIFVTNSSANYLSVAGSMSPGDVREMFFGRAAFHDGNSFPRLQNRAGGIKNEETADRSQRLAYSCYVHHLSVTPDTNHVNMAVTASCGAASRWPSLNWEPNMRPLHRLQTWATATRTRIYVIVVLVSIIPLALFLFSADWFLRRDTSRRIAQQSIDATKLVAERFEERFTTATTLAESFATRPSLIQAYEKRNIGEVERQLEQAQKLAAGSSAVAVFGIDQHLEAIYPVTQSDSFKDLASSGWFRDGITSSSPYVSDILRTGAKAEAAVVAVVLPLRDSDGQTTAVLTFFYPTDTLRKWTAGLGRSTSRFLFLVDRQGNAVAADKLSLSLPKGSLRQLEPVQQVLSGHAGGGVFELTGKLYQAAYKPIGAVGWGVVIALPFSDIQSAVSQFERPLALIGTVFLLIALGLGSVGARFWRRLRDSERQTRTVIETAHDAFIAFDDDGVVTDWNRQSEATFGWTRSEALGAPLRDLVIPERYREEHVSRLERFRATGEGVILGKRLEMTAINRSGQELPIEVTIAAVQSGKKHYLNAFIRDVTEQKQYKEGIEQKNRELDLRNREVERANQLKSQFLASMSHELRTPLNAILGFSDLLADGTAGSLTEKQSRWVNHISKGGKHLLQLINDILDLAKIEAGQVELEIEPFKVNAALPEVISNIRQIAMTKRIRLEIDCDPELQVKADRLRFKQILYNLLSNAVKFTAEGGRIRVEGKRGSTQAEFTVADSGVGIRAEELGVIFDEFRQVGDTTRGVREGTGLGLAITKRLVEQQGGLIRVESTFGEGTRFTFTLPVSDEPIVGAPSDSSSTADESDRPLVLIVDDEPAACELISGYLNPEGYLTATAHSGLEAINFARKLRPACITLDILMPSGSGWETLHELRQHPETQDIPIIVVSIVDQRRLGLALGAMDYLVKPVEREALLSCVQRRARPRSGTVAHCVAVDDDPAALRLMADTLAQAGFSVALATNGREALQAMRSKRTDLLLLDLVMPIMDGFEVVREAADDPALRDIPIVVLTAKTLTQEEMDLLGRTTQGVFRKDSEWRAGLIASVHRIVARQAHASGETASA
jgi:PAS domain S-box-containing protein